MRKNLLLTTALVAVSFVATNAWADTQEEWDGNSFLGVTSEKAARKVTGTVVANNAKVENNSNTSGGVGGAVYVQVPDGDKTPAGNLTLNGGTFSDNYSNFDGGAIGNYGNLIVNGTKFIRNKAQFESKTDDKGNTASSNDEHPIGGGAISLGAVSHTYIQGAEFNSNKSGTDGGAISTRHRKDGDLKDARLTIENSTFTSNRAIDLTKKGRGGAIYNSFAQDYNGNKGVLLKNNSFKANLAYYGGAIFGSSGSNTIIEGGLFDMNEAKQGGAILTVRKADDGTPGGQLTVKNGTRFESNIAEFGGGAIWSGGQTDVLGATFKNNQVTGTKGGNADDMDDGEAEGGGAIFVGSASHVDVQDSWFEGNSSGTVGGAIATRGESNDGTDSSLKVNRSHFVENHAGNSGGAINIGSTNQKDVTIENSEFDGNSSTNGGAIYSKGTVAIDHSLFKNNRASKNEKGGAGVGGALLISAGTVTANDLTFTGNSSANAGGAIYSQKGTLNLTGGLFKNNTSGGNGGAIASMASSNLSLENVTFEGNKAAKDGGAISTQATNTTFKGDNVFKDNYAGEEKNDINIVSSSTVTLEEGASLTLDGGITGSNGTLKLGNGSTLTVKDTTKVESKVSNGETEGNKAQVNIVLTDDTMKDGELNLSSIFTTNNGTLDVVKKGLTLESNNLYEVKEGEDNTYTVRARSTGDIANRLGVKNVEAATLLATSSSVTGSGNSAFDEIQDTLRREAQYGNDSATLSRAADALVADAAPVVQTHETMLSNMIFDAASDAMDDSLQNAAVGQSSGDSVFEKAKVWVKGLFNYADRDETSKARGFDMDTYGVAMGADKEVGAGKVGLGYAYSQSDINGYTRDTDVDTHTAFVYGQYKPADWYVKGVASYSWSDYEEKKSVLGKNADAKYDVNTWALEGLYGYDFHLDNGYDITPEGGLRYLHASQDSYTNGLGVRVKDRDIDVLTAVAGVKAAKNFALSNGMNIRPEVRAAVTYDLSTDDNNSPVVLTNGQAIKVNGEELDRFGVELGAKLATDITSQWEVSAGYEGRIREDYSDHTGMLSAKYKF